MLPQPPPCIRSISKIQWDNSRGCCLRNSERSLSGLPNSGGAAGITGLQFCFQGGPSFTCCAQARLLRPNPSLGLLISVWASVRAADLNAMDAERQVLLPCVFNSHHGQIRSPSPTSEAYSRTSWISEWPRSGGAAVFLGHKSPGLGPNSPSELALPPELCSPACLSPVQRGGM